MTLKVLAAVLSARRGGPSWDQLVYWLSGSDALAFAAAITSGVL